MVLSKIEQSIGVFSEGSPGILILYLHKERTCILLKNNSNNNNKQQ